MLKKVLVIIGLCLLAGYIVFAAFFFEEKPKELICSQFEVVVDNKTEGSFVNVVEIEKEIDKNGLSPYGKQLKQINTLAIEEVVKKNQLVKTAKVFQTSNSGIRVVITERIPVLRVISETGGSYYIDNEGFKMPLSKHFTAYLPIATGFVKDDFAKTELYKFALFLLSNTFWNAQIEQIVVLQSNEIKLIPRIGNHEILLGKLDNYEQKLEKLKIFYEKGLNETGWNKYSAINLKFDKQVVCTKR